MSSKRLYPFQLFCIIIVLSTMLAGCRLGRRAEPPPMPANLSERFTDTVIAGPLNTLAVKRGEVIQQALYSGQVVLARQENLFFRRSGDLAHVYVEDGDIVQEGDLIAELDSSLLQLDLEASLLGLDVANEELANAQSALDYRRRQAELKLEMAKLARSEMGEASPTGLDPVSAQVQQMQIELAEIELSQIDDSISPILDLNRRRAELSVLRIKDSILDGQIFAPFTGEIRFINLTIEPNKRLTLQANNAVARIVEPSSFQVELNLSRTQMEPLSEGMPVQLSAASSPGERIPGVIKSLPRPFGTGQGSLTEVALADPADSGKFYEGLTAAVSIAIASKADALLVPRTALHQENQAYYVMVQVGESVERANIAVGIIGSDWVEVVAGLSEGQLVVVN